jgi:hypothetical protein
VRLGFSGSLDIASENARPIEDSPRVCRRDDLVVGRCAAAVLMVLVYSFPSCLQAQCSGRVVARASNDKSERERE